ncbi:MAG TPA: N-formylglutamate deformylase [Woeseiaceae bacterium]|nr:N-formylglutamate deformylase [Woeseiaceae bacterium]|tara:strand:- start:17320 stop:18135 length:816 start_codon:yes stop_codon:yes gene_type:complete
MTQSEEIYGFHKGQSPLLVSIPHDGRAILESMSSIMTQEAQSLPDTDWHTTKLYEFCKSIDASVINANYSRYVIDLNRSQESDSLYQNYHSTDLCPIALFSGGEIYNDINEIEKSEVKRRVQSYWLPYHKKIKASLDAIKSDYGYALLWDAHSIQSRVPNLFEGKLPDLNIGTNSGESCPSIIERSVYEIARESDYSVALNERFKGGYITRHYGRPDDSIYAIQLEIAQSCYMDESSLVYDNILAEKLIKVLKIMMETFMGEIKESQNLSV